MHYVVMFSGGVGSWAAAKRVSKYKNLSKLTLLFADTLIEDEDLYRFLKDASKNIGVPITRVADGRTPWEIFKYKRFLSNTRITNCSDYLKRDMLDNWVTENCKIENTIQVVGIDWSEKHRMEGRTSKGKHKPGLIEKKAPWKIIAPMCEKPYLSKAQMIEWLKKEGIKPPRLYELGFPHNNCGGGCVKAGQAHFLHLLKTFPERFKEWEKNEQEIRDYLKKDVAILRDRRGGKTKPLTLKELRIRYEGKENCESDEWGGCGCYV